MDWKIQCPYCGTYTRDNGKLIIVGEIADYPSHNTMCWHFDGNLFSSPATQTISITMVSQLRIEVVNWVIDYSNGKTLKKLALWKPIESLIWLFLLLDLRVCINDYLFFIRLLRLHTNKTVLLETQICEKFFFNSNTLESSLQFNWISHQIELFVLIAVLRN